jgi:hypothetical protein
VLLLPSGACNAKVLHQLPSCRVRSAREVLADDVKFANRHPVVAVIIANEDGSGTGENSGKGHFAVQV